MAEHDDSPDHDKPGEPNVSPPAPRHTEDVVFPESFRKFWRTLLGPWGRR